MGEELCLIDTNLCSFENFVFNMKYAPCLLSNGIWIICWFLVGDESSRAGGRTYSVREVVKGRVFCFVLNSTRLWLHKQTHC